MCIARASPKNLGRSLDELHSSLPYSSVFIDRLLATNPTTPSHRVGDATTVYFGSAGGNSARAILTPAHPHLFPRTDAHPPPVLFFHANEPSSYTRLLAWQLIPLCRRRQDVLRQTAGWMCCRGMACGTKALRRAYGYLK